MNSSMREGDETSKGRETNYVTLKMGEDFRRIREIADRDFDGNLSMTVRRAVREFIDRDRSASDRQLERVS